MPKLQPVDSHMHGMLHYGGDINGGMVSEVNETNGATNVNEDKHLVHKNRFKTSKKDALKAPEKCEQVKDP